MTGNFMYERSTPRTVPSNCSNRTSVYTSNTTFFIWMFYNIKYTLELLFRLSLALNLAWDVSIQRFWIWVTSTCNSTFARSTGAATNVVGMADKKPAVAISAVDSFGSVLSGVTDKIKRFDASYAWQRNVNTGLCLNADLMYPEWDSKHRWYTEQRWYNTSIQPKKIQSSQENPIDLMLTYPVTPSLTTALLTTSIAPVYVPAGAVCNLVFVRSKGCPKSHNILLNKERISTR